MLLLLNCADAAGKASFWWRRRRRRRRRHGGIFGNLHQLISGECIIAGAHHTRHARQEANRLASGGPERLMGWPFGRLASLGCGRRARLVAQKSSQVETKPNNNNNSKL